MQKRINEKNGKKMRIKRQVLEIHIKKKVENSKKRNIIVPCFLVTSNLTHDQCF